MHQKLTYLLTKKDNKTIKMQVLSTNTQKKQQNKRKNILYVRKNNITNSRNVGNNFRSNFDRCP